MGEYPVYDDAVYDAFDAPDDRFHAYSAAIRSASAGRIVLDIGTGRDALWALAAARAGAAHVYAIEAHLPAAEAAARAVAAAGLADRVTVLPGHSTDQRLPVRPEVCVSEIVGNIASAEGMLAVLADARRRLCAPDCVWIPFRAQTWAAAVDVPAVELADRARPYVSAVFAAVGHPFDLRLCLGGPAADTIVSSAAPVESLVFDSRYPSPPAGEVTTVELDVRGRMTGLLLWARVAAAPTGREIDALTGGGRGWAPVYLPVCPAGFSADRPVRVSFTRRTSDDGIHPDFEVVVDGQPPYRSLHHGPEIVSPVLRVS